MSVPHHARHRVAPIPGDAMHAPPGNGDDLDESNDTALTRTRARVASSEIATHRGTADLNVGSTFLCRRVSFTRRLVALLSRPKEPYI